MKDSVDQVVHSAGASISMIAIINDADQYFMWTFKKSKNVFRKIKRSFHGLNGLDQYDELAFFSVSGIPFSLTLMDHIQLRV